MAAPADVHVPQPLAAEIVQQYADVLRVGRVRINGSEVCWSTSGSTPSQLKALIAAFCGALRKLPDMQDVEDGVLCQALYWFCKVVSINYALFEVLHVINEKVGKECTIRTTGKGGKSIVEYSVEVRENQLMSVKVSWSEKGNIVYYDPKTAKKTVKGTLSSLMTEFPMQPNALFTPTYSLDFQVNTSYKQKLISKIACATTNHRGRGSCMLLDTPLHSSSSLSLEASLTACSTEGPSSLPSECSVDSWQQLDALPSYESWEPPSPLSEGELFPAPLCFHVRSVRAI
jgi:hypothetical protein